MTKSHGGLTDPPTRSAVVRAGMAAALTTTLALSALAGSPRLVGRDAQVCGIYDRAPELSALFRWVGSYDTQEHACRALIGMDEQTCPLIATDVARMCSRALPLRRLAIKATRLRDPAAEAGAYLALMLQPSAFSSFEGSQTWRWTWPTGAPVPVYSFELPRGRCVGTAAKRGSASVFVTAAHCADTELHLEVDGSSFTRKLSCERHGGEQVCEKSSGVARDYAVCSFTNDALASDIAISDATLAPPTSLHLLSPKPSDWSRLRSAMVSVTSRENGLVYARDSDTIEPITIAGSMSGSPLFSDSTHRQLAGVVTCGGMEFVVSPLRP